MKSVAAPPEPGVPRFERRTPRWRASMPVICGISSNSSNRQQDKAEPGIKQRFELTPRFWAI